MHTKLVRDLLHKLSNKIVGLQCSLELIQPSDITPGPSQEAYTLLKRSVNDITNLIHESHQALTISYRKNYETYKGDPPLVDKNGTSLKLGDCIEVPTPEGNDPWEKTFLGVIISTTRGDNMICVRDTATSCWDVEANRIEKQ
jgi:hypothetical protein